MEGGWKESRASNASSASASVSGVNKMKQIKTVEERNDGDIDALEADNHENIVAMLDCFIIPSVLDRSVHDLYIVMQVINIIT